LFINCYLSNFDHINIEKMEKIIHLKGKESFLVSIFMIIFGILAFVPFILILVLRSIFGMLTEVKKHAHVESHGLVTSKLKD
jgi:hypothetical protein